VVALGAALQAASLDRARSKRAAAAKGGLRPIDPAHMPRASAASVPAIFTAPAATPSPTPVPQPISSVPGLESFGSIFATPPGTTPAADVTQPLPSSSSSGRLASVVDFGDLDLPSAVPLPGLPAAGASPVTPMGLGAVNAPGMGSRIPTLSGLPAMSAETIAKLQGGDERLRVEGRLPLLVDVTPLGLAIETAGGYAQFLVSANTPVPCDRTMRFATAADNQTSVVVRVAQGDAARFDGNALLGEVTLVGLRSASRGLVQIDVTFAIDVSGILHVSAKDVETGLETSAQIRLLGTRDDAADLEQMAKRQERFAEARTP
jgi:molecular chaperone DnaK